MGKGDKSLADIPDWQNNFSDCPFFFISSLCTEDNKGAAWVENLIVKKF
jgi:hypothetical protein